jgi:hypothetical protein
MRNHTSLYGTFAGMEGQVAESQQSCSTCRRRLPAAEFYDNCSECKECKRGRSRRNRALQARKLAAFERFVDVLISIADQTADAPANRRRDFSHEAVA